MAWTTPKMWSVGELLTASNMNAQVRDNLNALWNRAKASYSGSPNVSTTSTDWVNVDTSTLQLTLACTGADVLALFVAQLTWTNGSSWADRAFLRITCDGSVISAAPRVTRYGNDANYVVYPLVARKTDLSPGNHIFRVQWFVGGTVGLQVTIGPSEFIVWET